jgi:hypothetical protein
MTIYRGHPDTGCLNIKMPRRRPDFDPVRSCSLPLGSPKAILLIRFTPCFVRLVSKDKKQRDTCVEDSRLVERIHYGM